MGVYQLEFVDYKQQKLLASCTRSGIDWRQAKGAESTAQARVGRETGLTLDAAGASMVLSWKPPGGAPLRPETAAAIRHCRNLCRNAALVTEPRGLWFVLAFPGGLSGKEPACQCGRHKIRGFSPWLGEIPWRGARLPTPVSCPGEPHGLYSPWGREELDTAE